jgi:hypothetical protein
MESEWDRDKNANIVRYTRDNLPEDTESDLERVESMTESEIEQAARSDPDAPPADDKFLSQVNIVLSVPLDQDTFKLRQKRISIRKGAELLEISYRDFLKRAGTHQVSLVNYEEGWIDRELSALEQSARKLPTYPF